MATFHDRLEECFRFGNHSQIELADYLRVHKTVVNSWLRRKAREPREIDTVKSIARFFKVNPAWLAGFDVENISDSESDMLRKFRSLSEANRRLIISTIEALLPETEKNQNLRTA